VAEGKRGEGIDVHVTNETGAAIGAAFTDAGYGLAGARVTIFGAPDAATTDATRWFPGTLRAPRAHCLTILVGAVPPTSRM
jgi:hypothetical protein